MTHPHMLEIVQAGHPVLRQTARPLGREEILSPTIQSLIQQMKEKMDAAPGVGLAAPQIGEPIQLIVIEDKKEFFQHLPLHMIQERERMVVPFHVLINPILTVEDPKLATFFEGCLSLAGFVSLVPRAIAVKVEGFNERAEPVTIEARGWYARILQHETDHLQGCLCIDHAEKRSLMTMDNYNHFWKEKTVDEIRRNLALIPPSMDTPIK